MGDDPLAGFEPTPDDPLAGFAPSPPDRPKGLRRVGVLEVNRARNLPPARLQHTPPPIEELRYLVDMYRRRRDAIAIDRGTDGEEAERQALNIVCHQYVKKFGGALEDAVRVLRPLTIGATR
jgi:hypothetical protein